MRSITKGWMGQPAGLVGCSYATWGRGIGANSKIKRDQWLRKGASTRYCNNARPRLEPLIHSNTKGGYLRGVARALAARGVPTARGGSWTAVQVSDILHRVG